MAVGFTNVILDCRVRWGLETERKICSRRAVVGRMVDDADEPDQMLKDIAAMKKKMNAKKELEKSNAGVMEKSAKAASNSFKDLISTIFLYNFFAVIFFLVWLFVAIFVHYGLKSEVLLDPWLLVWQPLIQPLLGLLMMGTIISGTVSTLGKKEESQ